MSENKDKIVFFYKTSDKNGKKFMELFKSLTDKLYENNNLSMLRCNLEKNEVEDLLELSVENTPHIIFFRNKMTNHPIYFSNSVISPETII